MRPIMIHDFVPRKRDQSKTFSLPFPREPCEPEQKGVG
jgi:hypothetical protein